MVSNHSQMFGRVATVGAFPTVGRSHREEPTANFKSKFAVATSFGVRRLAAALPEPKLAPVA